MVNFSEIISNLEDMGFYDVFLPFILVYVVVFAILEKSGIFAKGDSDKQSKNVNAVIAFVFGLFFVASIQTVKYIQSLIVNIVLVIIFILVTLILMGFIFGKDYFKHLFHGKDDKVHKVLIWVVGGVVFLVALGILFSILGVWDYIWDFIDDVTTGNTLSTVLIFALIVGTLVWVTRGGDSSHS